MAEPKESKKAKEPKKRVPRDRTVWVPFAEIPVGASFRVRGGVNDGVRLPIDVCCPLALYQQQTDGVIEAMRVFPNQNACNRAETRLQPIMMHCAARGLPPPAKLLPEIRASRIWSHIMQPRRADVAQFCVIDVGIYIPANPVLTYAPAWADVLAEACNGVSGPTDLDL